jgi:acyl-CoA synthetase (NDP forming)/GNAT superfamily N-acetyltransferase
MTTDEAAAMFTGDAAARRGPELPGYPSSWEFDGLVASGEVVHVRPIRSGDAALLGAPDGGLCGDEIEHALTGAHPASSPDGPSQVDEVDYDSRMAFVAIVAGRLVGFASYDRLGSLQPVAEVVFAVADTYQGRGIAALLFESLAAYARTKGIVHFTAEVTPEHSAILQAFDATGLACTSANDGGTARAEIDLRPTPEYQASCDEREATAEVASISAILRPGSIAVIGAGRHPGNVGHEVVRSLLAGDFSGRVYPVNPSARAVCGVPAFPTLSSLPEPIDLAIIAVPATLVPGVVGEAASVGVRAATVITAGFGETGRSGAEVEAELLKVARHHGMRIVGPNCLGVVNTDPDIRMSATFVALDPLAGGLALVSQSGAVGIVLAEQARLAGLGLSAFVSVGNKLDVSANDLLCYFERDERTSVIALYLESLGNPRKFARIARRIGENKPIVALKAGRTPAGVRGARSHTAAAATPQVAVSALLQSAGVIKVDRLEELLDVSALLLATPLPAGSRIALVGNSGGPLILAADACEADGLSVPEFGDTTKLALRQVVVDSAAVANPVDMTADGGAEVLEHALEILLRDDAVDAAIVITTDLIALPAAAARGVVARVAGRSDKPVVACILGADAGSGPAGALGIAEIPSPERASTALAHVCSYAQWRRRPRSAAVISWEDSDQAAIRQIVSSGLARSETGGWLDLDEAARLIGACGVPMLPTRAATTAAEAASVAASIGFPVALKARSGDIVHKSDVGGVAVGLSSPEAVREAYETMAGRIGPQMGGAVIQPMAPMGVEAIIGLVSDPVFGPVVMVGLGGVMTDLLGDRAFAVPPFEAGSAEAMVASLHAAALLDGYRGAPLVDRRALVAVLEIIARTAEEVPELVELDLNPILVTSAGAVVVDCKARLAPRHAGPGPLFRSFSSPERD